MSVNLSPTTPTGGRRASTAVADKKKILLISGFHPDSAAARYSLPSARAFAVHKDPVLFVIPVTSGSSSSASTSLKKQVNATLIALHPLRDVICVHTPSASSADGPGFVQVFDLLTKARVAKVPVSAPPVLLRWLSPQCAAFISCSTASDDGSKAAVPSLEIIALPQNFAPTNALAGDVADIVRHSERLFPLFEDLLDLDFCRPCRIDTDIDPLYGGSKNGTVVPRWLLIVTHCANEADSRDPEASNDLVHQLHSVDKDASQLVSGQHARLHRRATDGRLFLYLVTFTQEQGLVLSVLAIRENENDTLDVPDMLQFELELPRDSVVIEIIPMSAPRTLAIFTHAGDIMVITTTVDGSRPRQGCVRLFSPESRPLAVIPALNNADSQLIVLESSGAIMRVNVRTGNPESVEKVVSPVHQEYLRGGPRSAPAQNTSFGLQQQQNQQPQPRARSNSLQPRSADPEGSGSRPVFDSDEVIDPALIAHLRKGDYTSAALQCATIPIRDITALRRALGTQPGSHSLSPNEPSSMNHQVDSRIAAFLGALLPLRQLTQSESVAYAQSSFSAIAALGSSGGGRDSINYATAVPAAVAARRLMPSEALADALLRGHSPALKSDWAAAAADVFQEIGMPERSISTLIVLDKCRELVSFLKRTRHAAPTDPNVLARLLLAPAPAPAELAVLMLESLCAESSSSTSTTTALRAMHARTLLDVLLRNPDTSNIIHFLDSVLEDTPEYGSMQTILLQMLNRTDASKFCVAADKYSHFDRRLFGLSTTTRKSAVVAPESLLSINMEHALASYSSEQWIEFLTQISEEQETALLDKLSPGLIATHLVDSDATCGIAKLISAVIDMERPLLLRKLTHRILNNNNKGNCSSSEEIAQLYISSSLLCSSNANVESTMGGDVWVSRYPAHTALVARRLGYLEFSNTLLSGITGSQVPRTLLVADDMGDLARALRLANEVNDSDVWRIVGQRMAAALESNTQEAVTLASAVHAATPATITGGGSSICIGFARG